MLGRRRVKLLRVEGFLVEGWEEGIWLLHGEESRTEAAWWLGGGLISADLSIHLSLSRLFPTVSFFGLPRRSIAPKSYIGISRTTTTPPPGNPVARGGSTRAFLCFGCSVRNGLDVKRA